MAIEKVIIQNFKRFKNPFEIKFTKLKLPTPIRCVEP